MKINEAYEQVTNRILDHLEKGVMPWKRDWSGYNGPTIPANVTSMKEYRGGNIINLWIEQMEKGYETPLWLTYKQAIKAGGNVKKGQKSTPVIHFQYLKREDDKGEEFFIPSIRVWTVFNIDQCENLELDLSCEEYDNDPIAECEKFVKATKADIRNGNPAYYPTGDYITLPALTQFHSSEIYYQTAFHELSHWTGHKSRLDRGETTKKRTEYAFEELVAELSAAFLCAEFKFDSTSDQRSAEYLAGWIKMMKDDKKAFMAAAAKAQAACDFLHKMQ